MSLGRFGRNVLRGRRIDWDVGSLMGTFADGDRRSMRGDWRDVWYLFLWAWARRGGFPATEDVNETSNQGAEETHSFCVIDERMQEESGVGWSFYTSL